MASFHQSDCHVLLTNIVKHQITHYMFLKSKDPSKFFSALILNLQLILFINTTRYFNNNNIYYDIPTAIFYMKGSVQQQVDVFLPHHHNYKLQCNDKIWIMQSFMGQTEKQEIKISQKHDVLGKNGNVFLFVCFCFCFVCFFQKYAEAHID